MSIANDESLHQTALKLVEDVKNLSIYKSFYSDVQKVVCSPIVNKEEFKHTLQKAMKENGLDVQLRNTVYHWVQSQSKQNKLDPITCLAKASTQWEKRIHKSLNSMCSDLETSLAKLRPQSEQEELSDKWSELSTYSLDLSKYRPVYAPKDFLEVLLTLSGYIPFTRENEPKWEFAHLPLPVKTLNDLVLWDHIPTRKRIPVVPYKSSTPTPPKCICALYVEWHKGEPHLGVNPQLPSTLPGYTTLEQERIALADRVSSFSYVPVIQEFLKKGSPQSYRAKLWAKVLETEIQPWHHNYFNQLKKHVLEVDLMIDKLIFKDVQLTASNDDQYFVFEDLLYQVILCFSRDSKIVQALKTNVGAPLTANVKGIKQTDSSSIMFPPSGIIPFHGFTMYATPFCYLYDDPVQLYFTFRAFYVRYFNRLHNLSTNPQGIVSLCLLYERLLETYEPLLWIHFRNINVNPIRVVFKWLMRAFSGHLPPDQLLLLWDAILGYDSLEILPLLAVAILSFRKENLFQVNTIQNVDAVLADLSTISVISLLHLALIKG